MKIPRVLAAAAVALGAGCHSLDNPFSSIPNTGRDARIYNVQTGRWEWPEKDRPRSTPKPARTAAATPAPKDDGRNYDPQKGRFANPEPGR